MIELDEFTLSYIECALWASVDENGEPLDGLYSIDDLAPSTLASMREDCEAFQRDEAEHLATRDAPERAGHDFWLTRNRHGAGFWDGDWPEPSASKLTDASHTYGSCDLYVGDDGLIYEG